MPLPRRFPPPRHVHARARSAQTLLFTLAAALACGLLFYTAARPAGARSSATQTPQTGLVDMTASNVAPALGTNAVFGGASISADGRYVAFTSESPDLTPDAPTGSVRFWNVFVRDRRAARTILVSVNYLGTGPGGGFSFAPVITPDGRYVAFISNGGVVPLDQIANGSFNVYRRDLLTNQTVLVSRTPAGRAGDADSGSLPDAQSLSISADGRYVCFVSNVADLVAGDNNGRSDIFVRDMQTGSTRLVSVNTAGTSSGNAATTYAVISPDGRYVAFRSLAGDLVANDTNNHADIFLRDLQTNTTRLVSARPDGASGNADSNAQRQETLAVSNDGRFVAFTSLASDLVIGDSNGFNPDAGQDVFVRDTVTGVTRLVSVNTAGTASGNGPSGGLSMTPDGRFVTFFSFAGDLVANDTNGLHDVFVRDLQTNTTRLVSVNMGGTAGGVQNPLCNSNPTSNDVSASNASISNDGRFITFVSAAADLTATPDTNCSAPSSLSGYDIFVRDMQAGSTRLVSVNRTGAAAAADSSFSPIITPDGRYILFRSHADDLVPNTSNGLNLDYFVNVNQEAAGQVRFAQQVFQVSEAAGQAVLTVPRTPGATGAATVAYETVPGGTATAGSDFTPVSGTLNFAAGEESKQLVVPIFNDAADEDDETVFVRLTDEAAGSVGEPALAAVLITDDDPAPLLSISDARVGEGDSGGTQMTFLVTLSEPSQRTITAEYRTLEGTATGDNFPLPGSDYAPAQGRYTFPPGVTSGLLKVSVVTDTRAEPDETFSVVFTNSPNAQIDDGVGVGTILDDDGAVFTKVSLAANNFEVTETAGRLDVQVARTGDLSGVSTVNYLTSGTGSMAITPRVDYTQAAGVLKFAPGEALKTISLFVTDDAWAEGNELFLLTLYEPEGCTFGQTYTAQIFIKSDDAASGPSPARPEGSTAFFVRQHYRDFLGRDPDPAGFNFWTNVIEACGADAQCREVKRVNVSAAFFLSIEFQETGFLAYRTYKAAYGNLAGRPVPIRLFDFIHDAQQLGRDVVVNQGDWRGQLEQNKRDYFERFVRSESFSLVYAPSLTPAEFVSTLDTNAGSVLTANERASLVAALAAGTKTRAEVLRAVAENAELARREFNRAFVLMQYFGYLRRNPDESPDGNFAGYNFWLGKLEEFKGDYIGAEMVKAFVSSDEYLKRFGL